MTEFEWNRFHRKGLTLEANRTDERPQAGNTNLCLIEPVTRLHILRIDKSIKNSLRTPYPWCPWKLLCFITLCANEFLIEIHNEPEFLPLHIWYQRQDICIMNPHVKWKIKKIRMKQVNNAEFCW
jgi:hypothetical protein